MPGQNPTLQEKYSSGVTFVGEFNLGGAGAGAGAGSISLSLYTRGEITNWGEGVICYAVALCYTMKQAELVNYFAPRPVCFNYNLIMMVQRRRMRNVFFTHCLR